MTDKKQKIQLRFNIPQLEQAISVLLNFPTNKKFAGNTFKLFNTFLPESYLSDYEKEVRVFLIKKLAKIILDNNIDSKTSFLNFINFDGKYEKEANEIINNLFELEPSDSEIALIDKLISEQLRYGIVGNKADSLNDLLTSFQTETYDDLESFMVDFSTNIDSIGRSLREAKESIEERQNDVSFADNSFIETIRNIIKEDNQPCTKIKTGIQALNKMFNGGYERARLYIALGLAKGWKSGYLLNSCLWACKYNKFETKDPNKKPVVLYISMENSVKETIKRVWSHCFGNDSNMSEHNPIEASRMLESAGYFTVNKPDSAELVVVYRPNKSMNVSDIDSFIEDLEKQGKEVVFLVQDYLKRLRPQVPTKDLRLDLSSITDDLANLSKARNIPILTAMQLNKIGLISGNIGKKSF